MDSSRGVCIAGNWKMNHDRNSIQSFFSDIHKNWNEKISQNKKLEKIIFPTTLGIETCLAHQGNTGIEIGAQNVHWKESGAYTGEISGPILKELGVQWVLTGHSERRQFFGETNESVYLRTSSLLKQGFRVIACIGESKNEKENNQTQTVIESQLSAIFPKEDSAIQNHLNGQLVLAYEPVWAIGTGLTATPYQAEEAHALIRAFLKSRFSENKAKTTKILYGGSVKPANLKELLSCPNVDGGLVGGASLRAEDFYNLLHIANEISG